jgi:hypothetical protein
MPLQDAINLFQRLGIHVSLISRSEFQKAYHQLAWRYLPDQDNPRSQELMALINAARTSIIKTYRWTEERSADRPERAKRPSA